MGGWVGMVGVFLVCVFSGLFYVGQEEEEEEKGAKRPLVVDCGCLILEGSCHESRRGGGRRSGLCLSKM